MSLGGQVPSDPILVDAIHKAAANNILLVASAGNDDGYVGWPAADLQPSGGGRSYGLAVGAIDVDGRRASFSNWGKHLSLVAPGTYRSSAPPACSWRFRRRAGSGALGFATLERRRRRPLRLPAGHVVRGARGSRCRGARSGPRGRS